MKSNNNLQPNNFELETSTVWSFPKRGSWATHTGKYRGNWAPQVVRNIILRYSREGDFVLDPMVGSGTTLIEAKLTNRKTVGIDVNPKAVKLSKRLTNFENPEYDKNNFCKVGLGDARDVNFLKENSVDLITLHPPYANIIEYSNGKNQQDLSSLNIEKFYQEMKVVAEEMFRILKPGKFCAVLIGDTRKNKNYIPLACNVMNIFLDVGFILKEDIIKHQWNTKTEDYWSEKSKKYNFLLIKHEHLFVFRKH